MTVSSAVFLNLSSIVAFLSVGGVMRAKFTTWVSSSSLMQATALAGSVTTFSIVCLVCLLFPCTVAKVMMIAVAPGSRVGT